jgi:hypothetical protein
MDVLIPKKEGQRLRMKLEGEERVEISESVKGQLSTWRTPRVLVWKPAAQ